MKFIFRTDSSQQIGSGHVMRCLPLAHVLKRRGADVSFVCRAFGDALIPFIRAQAMSVIEIPLVANWQADPNASRFYANWLGASWEEDANATLQALSKIGTADWIITDHYGLNAKWESALKPTGAKILVIDDLADRPHEADVLLDQNFFIEPNIRYTNLLPQHCLKLLGPSYALLRPEFTNLPKPTRRDLSPIKRILIFFGAGDPSRLVLRTTRALLPLAKEYSIKLDVVSGSLNPDNDNIKAFCQNHSECVLYDHPVAMSERLAAADLFVGAGGIITWERCAYGVPGVIIAAAANQNPFNVDLAASGCQVFLGAAADVSDKDIVTGVKNLITDSHLREAFAKRSCELVDGHGVSRVAAVLCGETPKGGTL